MTDPKPRYVYPKELIDKPFVGEEQGLEGRFTLRVPKETLLRAAQHSLGLKFMQLPSNADAADFVAMPGDPIRPFEGLFIPYKFIDIELENTPDSDVSSQSAVDAKEPSEAKYAKEKVARMYEALEMRKPDPSIIFAVTLNLSEEFRNVSSKVFDDVEVAKKLRKDWKLDELDQRPDPRYLVRIPGDTLFLSTTFMDALFGKSIKGFNSTFLSVYYFECAKGFYPMLERDVKSILNPYYL